MSASLNECSPFTARPDEQRRAFGRSARDHQLLLDPHALGEATLTLGDAPAHELGIGAEVHVVHEVAVDEDVQDARARHACDERDEHQIDQRVVIELALLALRERRVDDELALDQADAHGRDGLLDRHLRQRQRGAYENEGEGRLVHFLSPGMEARWGASAIRVLCSCMSSSQRRLGSCARNPDLRRNDRQLHFFMKF